jgi:hypothetical protein
VYRLKETLCSRPDDAQVAFSVLEGLHGRFAEAVRGTVSEVSWGQGNVPIHMVEACVWLDRGHSDQDAWVETAIAAAERLGKAFKGGAEFVNAVRLDWTNNQGAEEALKKVAQSDDANERRAEALLILARRAKKAGDAEKAGQFVAQMPETGAQHVGAVAARLLAQ